MKHPTKQTCGTCICYEPMTDRVGKCYRNPPTAALKPGGYGGEFVEVLTVRPEVEVQTRACVEWSPADGDWRES